MTDRTEQCNSIIASQPLQLVPREQITTKFEFTENYENNHWWNHEWHGKWSLLVYKFTMCLLISSQRAAAVAIFLSNLLNAISNECLFIWPFIKYSAQIQTERTHQNFEFVDLDRHFCQNRFVFLHSFLQFDFKRIECVNALIQRIIILCNRDEVFTIV